MFEMTPQAGAASARHDNAEVVGSFPAGATLVSLATIALANGRMARCMLDSPQPTSLQPRHPL